MRRTWLLGIGLALLAAAGTASAQSADTDAGVPTGPSPARYYAGDQARLQLGRSLAASGRPRSLYAAWMLAPLRLELASGKFTYSVEVEGWFTRAVRTGATDPLIAQAAINYCIHANPCDLDVEEARTTLETADVDDVGSQLLLLQLAERRKDRIGAERAWQRAGTATQFRDPLMGLIGLLDEASSEQSWQAVMATNAALVASDQRLSNASDDRLLHLSAAAAMHAPFAVSATLQACKDAGQERVAQCRHLFGVMANSSSIMLAIIGASRMAEIEPAASAKKHWQARVRQLTWLSLEVGKLLGDGSEAAHRVRLVDYMNWVKTQGELPAVERVALAHAVPLQPPAGWQPTQPEI